MLRLLIVALGGVLAGASLAFGQAVPAMPAPAPVVIPPDSTSVELTPEEHAHFNVDGFFHAPGVWTVDGDYVLWVLPKRTPQTTVATTAVPGTAVTGTVRTDSMGDEHLDRHEISGGRFAVGYWLTEKNPWLPCGELPTLGVEARFFFLGQTSQSFADNQSPTLVRPFFDSATGTESSVIIATPGVATGRISGSVQGNLWGGEANLWQNIYCEAPGTACTVDGMVGLRYLDRDTSAKLAELSQFLPGLAGNLAPLSGDLITGSESFGTHNHFYGGQIGLRARSYLGPVILSAEFGLGLGVTDEVVNIQGSSVRTTPTGVTTVSPGALLALPGDIGQFSKEKFAQVPEGTLTFGFPVMDRLTVSLGVTGLYWSRIVQIGDQLPTQINSSTIPNFPGAVVTSGSQGVGVPFRQSDLWLVGAFLSAEYKW